MLGNSFDGPFFWSMPWEMLPEVDFKHFRHQKNIFWGSRKSIWAPKKAKFCELRAKLGHLRLIKAEELTWWTIFLVYVMENVTRSSFKEF